MVQIRTQALHRDKHNCLAHCRRSLRIRRLGQMQHLSMTELDWVSSSIRDLSQLEADGKSVVAVTMTTAQDG